MALTGADIAAEVPGLFAALTAADATKTQVVLKVKPKYQWSQSVAIAANGALESPIGAAELDCNITSAVFYPGATSAANSTNFASLTLEQSTPLGVITAMGAAITTASTAITKAVPRALSLTPASCFVPQGNQIVFAVAQTASGVAVGPGTLIVDGVYT